MRYRISGTIEIPFGGCCVAETEWNGIVREGDIGSRKK